MSEIVMTNKRTRNKRRHSNLRLELLVLSNRQGNLAIKVGDALARLVLEIEHLKLINQCLSREIEQLKEKQ